ncbi:hypothetical protein B0H14DRAFT_2559071 [Mycena olivaceomarginata]|nr:hypothetical protein B0H14DRAFT_2559071 [Mycena olivaceomarginata]
MAMSRYEAPWKRVIAISLVLESLRCCIVLIVLIVTWFRFPDARAWGIPLGCAAPGQKPTDVGPAMDHIMPKWSLKFAPIISTSIATQIEAQRRNANYDDLESSYNGPKLDIVAVQRRRATPAFLGRNPLGLAPDSEDSIHAPDYTSLFYGPIYSSLAGSQVNWALISALALQVYKFHVSFPKERTWIKALVYMLFLLQLTQTAIMSHFAFEVLCLRWGEPTAFLKLPWSSLLSPISGGVTSTVVQIFFARLVHTAFVACPRFHADTLSFRRIFVLKRDTLWARVVAVAIILLALMQGLAGIINTAKFAVTKEVSQLEHLGTGVKVWLIGSAVCDVAITVTMSFILAEYRSSTPWQKTDTLITKLIFNTVETGAVTIIVATVEVVLFILFPATNLDQLPYAIVLVVSLNARAGMGTQSGLIHTALSGDHELAWRVTKTDQEAPRIVYITTELFPKIEDDISRFVFLGSSILNYVNSSDGFILDSCEKLWSEVGPHI